MQLIRSLALAAVFVSFSAGAGMAAPVSAPPQQSVLDGGGLLLKVQGRCESLRRACEMKDRLGERGEGNCRRYREECGGGRMGDRASICSRLRRACLYKEDRGEVGQGNCRRYREMCR